MTKLKKVLVVDSSKVVRASLIKHLHGHFTVSEENNGESAWQTLVLDSSIVAIISSQHLAQLDGVGLVERIRENKLSRLNRLPLFLLVSDTFSEEEQQIARQQGVSGFIPKGLPYAEMDALIHQLINAAIHPDKKSTVLEAAKAVHLEPASSAEIEEGSTYTGGFTNIGLSDVLGRVGQSADDEAESSQHEERRGSGKEVDGRRQLDEFLLNIKPGDAREHSVSVLVFGLDGFDDLLRRYGSEVAGKVAGKFSTLLLKKIRADDRMGQMAPGRIAIIAPQTNRQLCSGFAERVCKALVAAQIVLRGKKISLTVSVGIASLPEDGVALSGEDLLMLADGRLDSAIRAGGNQVLAGTAVVAQDAAQQQDFLVRLKELIAGTTAETMTPCLGSVGLQIMPILMQLEQSFHFGLPIDDMNRRLWARARAERMAQ